MLTPSILYFIIIYLILLRAKTLTSSGGVIERVQILLLVAFLFLVNIAQRADEILLMVCLLLRHQYLRNQVALLTINTVEDRDAGHVYTTHTFRNFQDQTSLGLRFTTMTEGFPGIISESNYE